MLSKARIAVFVSGGGTNLQAILNAAAAGGQVTGKSLEEVAAELAQAIDQYLEDE